MDKYSYLSGTEIAVVEDLYQQYIKDPSSVDKEWARFFEGFEFARKDYEAEGEIPENFHKEFKVIRLIEGYRSRGHLFTKTNPVRERRKYSPTLDIENFGLDESDMDMVFQAATQVGMEPSTLRDIIAHLKEVYCESIGVEFAYIRHPEVVDWIKEKIHHNNNKPQFSVDQKKHILHKLNQAVVFEEFLHKKYVGQKRFSLQGGESLIPALDAIVEKGSEYGVEEFVFGMAHRGRLNVLANIFNKTYADIFNEFEGKEFEADGLFDGDVKYHMGYSCDIVTDAGKKVHMTLAPNPSHLEAVDPIVEGITRAKIDAYLEDEKKIVPVLIHGDAAIAGQGVVYEVIQMAQLSGYKTGGTVHIVINNQVGFTTNYLDGRSSTYCTDVGKVTLSPVFHVNGDDVEALVHAVQIGLEYRQQFSKDIFIDLLCYRKYGHNEGDEPRFTQPVLYKAIAKHPNPRELYRDKLLQEGVIGEGLVKEMESRFNEMLQERFEDAKQEERSKITHFLEYTWEGIRYATDDDADLGAKTGYDKKKLTTLAQTISKLPQDKNFLRKIQRIMDDRLSMVNETDKLDWAMGETLAYATLLKEGYPVRVSGQDVERGTFSHRHAVVKVEDSEEEYVPLNNLGGKQAEFTIYNSLLSEYAVLGFEYGYAMATPNGLTIWEAQFGDFNNGAQIIIDQFLSAAEDKWKVMSGLVLLLPHGYEGQGSEHSSARLERYLTLCAEYNMQIANCSTPANMFHVLRRQLHRDYRKPLVVFTPKKLLRHPKCTSTIEELANGTFQEIIDDATAKPAKVKRLVLCSGKVYYDLMEYKQEINDESSAFIRVEQLYPFPRKKLDELRKKYKNARELIWVQEEPENMGAWSYILRTLRDLNPEVISRHESGSPAPGSPRADAARQKDIFDRLFKNVSVTA